MNIHFRVIYITKQHTDFYIDEMASCGGLIIGSSPSGAKVLGHEGETYHKPRKQKGCVTWRCSKTPCTGSIQIATTGDRILKSLPHNHTQIPIEVATTEISTIEMPKNDDVLEHQKVYTNE